MIRVVLVCDEYLHIEGYKGIIEYNENTISLKYKNKMLNITGTNLLIENFSNIEIDISGVIQQITWEQIKHKG